MTVVVFARRWACRLALAAAWLALLPATTLADDDLESLEQKSLAAAVDRVAPCVVGIETVGGMERVETVLFGTGPTTGLVIDPQGYIVSSAFNFVNKPASILVRLPDGTRKSAKLVARDHNRMIVLLKIDVDKPLPAPEIAPESDVRVGQWCVGVGRTFETDRPNMAVGIVSATGRIWGKAIQTDAAMSPNNYGGPLIDVRGRVLGVIVPLSPQSAEEIAGLEWYDSGIGFAVPAEHIRKMLPRLKEGKDLYAGVAGFYLKSRDLYTGDTTIGSCRPGSPADKGGFRPDDRIVEIAGRKITRSAELKEEISRRYAGDKIVVVALRGKERIQAELQLIDKMPAYQDPLLGILPVRCTTTLGVTVRYVYPKSPAARAGIVPGDVLTKVAGKAVADRDELLQAMSAFEAGQEAEIEFRHGAKSQTVKLKLDGLSEAPPPADLPPAVMAIPEGDFKPIKTGVVPLRVPEFKNEAWAYVPETYHPKVACGLVVLLHGSTPLSQKELLERWRPLCDSHDLILVVPKSGDAAGWTNEEAGLVQRLMQQAKMTYNLDATRVVVYGRESGGALACLLAFHAREILSAAVVIDALPPGQPPDNEPQHRLTMYLATAAKSPHADAMNKLAAALRAKKIPVTLKKLGDKPRELDAGEVSELVRWIDMLDRI